MNCLLTRCLGPPPSTQPCSLGRCSRATAMATRRSIRWASAALAWPLAGVSPVGLRGGGTIGRPVVADTGGGLSCTPLVRGNPPSSTGARPRASNAATPAPCAGSSRTGRGSTPASAERGTATPDNLQAGATRPAAVCHGFPRSGAGPEVEGVGRWSRLRRRRRDSSGGTGGSVWSWADCVSAAACAGRWPGEIMRGANDGGRTSCHRAQRHRGRTTAARCGTAVHGDGPNAACVQSPVGHHGVLQPGPPLQLARPLHTHHRKCHALPAASCFQQPCRTKRSRRFGSVTAPAMSAGAWSASTGVCALCLVLTGIPSGSMSRTSRLWA